MEIKRYRVYIAGPVTKGIYVENMRQAIEAADVISERGHFPFTPHLFDLWALMSPVKKNQTFMFEQVSHWLQFCDIIVRLPGESSGADREVSMAYDKGIPVYYGVQEFKESPHWAEGIPEEAKEKGA